MFRLLANIGYDVNKRLEEIDFRLARNKEEEERETSLENVPPKTLVWFAHAVSLNLLLILSILLLWGCSSVNVLRACYCPEQ
jgi:hypothetical protein